MPSSNVQVDDRAYDLFECGDVKLRRGGTLPDAVIAYKTYGSLNGTRDNVVVIPTYYTGTHISNEAFFGAGRAIDPARHFVICPNLFGNGLSTSPSNARQSIHGSNFPLVTLSDNIFCQKKLLHEVWGIDKIQLVTGLSVAGCQAFQWAAQYPHIVERILPFCASARVSPHNFVFLEGVKAALQADCEWKGGRYERPPGAGLRAFARVYAGWGYSQAFYREGKYRHLGYETIEDLFEDWEAQHLQWDANDLLAKLATWQNHDISDNERFAGDLDTALGAIDARAIVLACSTDLYFTVADNAREVDAMRSAELRVYESDWGHCVASGGKHAGFQRFLDQAVNDLLAGA